MKKSFYPTNLKCEYLENPLGIDTNTPRFSWRISSCSPGFLQSAYQILISASEENLEQCVGDFFDSGKVLSDKSIQVEIGEAKHTPRKKYYWKVRVWDAADNVSDYSEAAVYETGIMDSMDFESPNRPALEAKWISSPEYETPLFRKVFEIKKEIKKARAYICGLGYYELYLNGKKVEKNVLDPAQTDYEQRALYVTYNVEKHLTDGKNSIGIILGNGWYNQYFIWSRDFSYGKPAFILEIQIDYTDGTTEKILSDGTFKTARSPILNNNVYAGEEYDARLEIPGWQSLNFDDSNWKNAKWYGDPTRLLSPQTIPSIRKIKTLKPVAISEPQPNVFIYDMGQNFSGWAKLKVKAERGTKITLRFVERLHQDGTIDATTTGAQATKVIQTLTYICKGGAEEIYEPRFTYFGFRYVEMTGYPGKPSLENLEGVVVHTDVQPTGNFICSDDMINKLHAAALWTQLTNLHGIPTDCPHREKCGWLGDAHITAEMTMYNFDMAQFWKKFVEDIETTRRGKLPYNIAPGKRLCLDNPDWQVAFIIIPYFLYLYYGEEKVLKTHYAGMKQLADYLAEISENYIIKKGFGDWCEPGTLNPKSTPVALTSTAFYFFAIKMMSKIADVIGKKDDANFFNELREKIKQAFINKFYDAKKNTFGSQCGNSMALYLKLFPKGDAEKIAAQLAKDVADNFNHHVSTGIFGTRYLFRALAEYGYEDVALKLLNQTSAPSLGHTFKLGMTTFVERLPMSDANFYEQTSSLNHPMTGAFTAWFYQGIGGIVPDENAPGFKHFYLKPQMTKVLNFADVEFDSPYGKIISKWKNAGGKFIWEIVVPENTRATVYFPTKDFTKIKSENNEVKINEDCAAKLFHGRYNFEIYRP